jgi:hypothetical protein
MKLSEWMFPCFETPPADGGGAGAGAGAPPAAGEGSGQPPAGAGAGSGGSSPAAGTQAGQTGSQPQGGAPEPEYEVPVAGQKVKVKQSELLAGYSRTQDYTRKTQELADSRKKFESEYSTRVRQAVDAEIQRLVEEQKRRGQGQGDEQPDPVAEIRTRQEQLEAKIADDKLDRTLAELKKEFPSLNERLFLLEAAEAKVQRFEDFRDLAQKHHEARESERLGIFESMAGDDKHPVSSKWRQKIIDDYIAAKAKEKPAGETGGGGSPGGAGPKPPPKDLNEADARAMEALTRLP